MAEGSNLLSAQITFTFTFTFSGYNKFTLKFLIHSQIPFFTLDSLVTTSSLQKRKARAPKYPYLYYLKY